MRGWVVLLWAVVATIVLVALGIFGTLLVSGKVTLFPTPTPTATPVATVAPVVDPSFSVLVLNATPKDGLGNTVKDQIIAANVGWTSGNVTAGAAGSKDFAETTVYYALPADEAAARGLAGVIGGAAVAQSNIYQPATDPEAKQLTVVVGLDRVAGASASPSATK